MKTEIEWIPVERELPPDDTSVLIAARGGVSTMIASSPPNSFWCPMAGNLPVTHWAHLPKHPAQLEDEG